MGKTLQILLAGFGGQGVLFAGKFLAYAGLLLERQVSWLPSYGPEMRGGTANCSVIISDTPVGSPIVSAPDVLIAMNLPSYEKYLPTVKPGGTVIYDAALIQSPSARPDVTLYPVPATSMAAEQSLGGLANMILTGKFLKACMPEAIPLEEGALGKVIPPKKANLLGANLQALSLGLEA